MTRVPMRPRAIDEPHRAATPLELLFDLVFVVAVALAAAELAHGIEEVHVTSALASYLAVFFAIWWAWMGFTWFASAYDCDDVPYRLLTMVQMGGVLVLAAGVQPFVRTGDTTAIVVGYVVMRLAMVVQWLRAARGDHEHLATARAYAVGVAVVQVGWILRLFLPAAVGAPTFLLLVLAELAVPFVAERRSRTMTPWHPHHIAERYALFTIIVLGECVLAAVVALRVSIDAGGWSADLVLTGAGALVLVFALWWFYFLKDSAGLLARRRERAFRWGYGHYGILAAGAAVGAGLEVAAVEVGTDVAASPALVAGALAVPVAVFLLLVWFLHAEDDPQRGRQLGLVLLACAGLAVVVALVGVGLPLPWAVPLMAVPPAALVAYGVRAADRRDPVSAREGSAARHGPPG